MNMRRRATAAWTLAFTALLAACASAETSVAISRNSDKVYQIEGSFEVPASSEAVWDVLADYERIPQFVKSMRSSRVRERRADGSLLLEQDATGGMFFVSKTVHVVLEVRRQAGRLDFNDVDHRDFWIYSGGWSTNEGPDGTRVNYSLLAQPDFPAPSFMMRGVMRRGARELLEQIRAEILRRPRPAP